MQRQLNVHTYKKISMKNLLVKVKKYKLNKGIHLTKLFTKINNERFIKQIKQQKNFKSFFHNH